MEELKPRMPSITEKEAEITLSKLFKARGFYRWKFVNYDKNLLMLCLWHSSNLNMPLVLSVADKIEVNGHPLEEFCKIVLLIEDSASPMKSIFFHLATLCYGQRLVAFRNENIVAISRKACKSLEEVEIMLDLEGCGENA